MNSLTPFLKDKKVLVTGHTGFKGSWLTLWLLKAGANVCGVALPPRTVADNFVVSALEKRIENHFSDIRDIDELKKIINNFQPEIVFHLAAQPIVRYSYQHPVETTATNVMGTVNLLDACRQVDSVRSIVIVTTDKCYENKELSRGYREDDRLGGYDPYSASKAAAEILTASFRRSYFSSTSIGVATARAGNVIGGGDWQVDRIIPDCFRALELNKKIIIRNPDAIRPWQHVLEPVFGYFLLAEKLWEEPALYSEAWNFGPGDSDSRTVMDLVRAVIRYYGEGEYSSPANKDELHETHILLLDNSKALKRLGWKPVWDFSHTVGHTVEWYKNYQTVPMYEFCLEQIQSYESYLQR